MQHESIADFSQTSFRFSADYSAALRNNLFNGPPCISLWFSLQTFYFDPNIMNTHLLCFFTCDCLYMYMQQLSVIDQTPIYAVLAHFICPRYLSKVLHDIYWTIQSRAVAHLQTNAAKEVRLVSSVSQLCIGI